MPPAPLVHAAPAHANAVLGYVVMILAVLVAALLAWSLSGGDRSSK